MPFRDRPELAAEAFDPLARFFELDAAFEAERGFWGDRVPLRLVAANLVLIAGEAGAIATQVRAIAGELERGLSVPSPIRLLIAAVLLQRGDRAADLCAEVERVRGIMRALRMRRYETYEVTAILALRIRNALEPIREDQVERMRLIYEAMKAHHWLLTGPEDYPACAFLVGRVEQTPEAIAGRANAIYEGLRERAKLWRGDPLQAASNMLCLSPLEPGELVERFCLLAEAFARAGVRVRQGEYDEVAILCFVARPAQKIIETVVEYGAAIRERLGWAERPLAFGLATNLAFVRLLGDHPQLGALADAKTLLDMQTIIVARQASADGSV